MGVSTEGRSALDILQDWVLVQRGGMVVGCTEGRSALDILQEWVLVQRDGQH